MPVWDRKLSHVPLSSPLEIPLIACLGLLLSTFIHTIPAMRLETDYNCNFDAG